ncbi:MAG: hypothetical protein JWM58_195 [Rhizobium sp.]|nr:hypothetical protein [Rhizobium sp.]
MKYQYIIAALAMALLSSCASRSKNIEAAYVSTTLYHTLTCKQLKAEAENVSSRAALASGKQDQKANGDAVMMGVGLVVFWPALLFTEGDGASAAEVSRLKGEMVAIEEASAVKQCGIKFEREPAPAPKKKP